MTARSEPSLDARQMTLAAFAAISDLAKSEAGLVLPQGKATMVQSRLRKRLRHLGLNDLETYANFVCSKDGVSERRYMISALTTNVSHFFREPHHFTILENKVFPRLIERARAGGRVRIWSAGCSSGQEPYSIAMSLLTAAPDIGQRDVLILGSDIDPAIIAAASNAEYTSQQISGIPDSLRNLHLIRGADGIFQISPQVKKITRFRELNLLAPWPMKGKFDFIFCRNVVIYFDQHTQASLWPRFHAALGAGGWLFVGHSERIGDEAMHLFQSIGQTAYRTATGQM